MSENPTIFDRIVAGELPADIVYEDEGVLAFRDLNPKAPVHVLVIPKKKIARSSELVQWSAEQTGAFFQSVSRAAESLGLNDDGYRIVLNCGPNAGQEVEYLHAHILGGRKLHWPPG